MPLKICSDQHSIKGEEVVNVLSVSGRIGFVDINATTQIINNRVLLEKERDLTVFSVVSEPLLKYRGDKVINRGIIISEDDGEISGHEIIKNILRHHRCCNLSVSLLQFWVRSLFFPRGPYRGLPHRQTRYPLLSEGRRQSG
jgi:hypothetical protein